MSRHAMSTFESEGKEKWAQMIGYIFISFGDIEMITYRCIRTFPSENILPSVRNMKLAARIDLICNVLSSKFDARDSNKMVSLLGRVKHLAKKRNLIAHNPMSLDIYENEQGKITGLKEVIRSEIDDSKYVHYDELNELYNEITEIVPKLLSEYSHLDEINIFGKNA